MKRSNFEYSSKNETASQDRKNTVGEVCGEGCLESYMDNNPHEMENGTPEEKQQRRIIFLQVGQSVGSKKKKKLTKLLEKNAKKSWGNINEKWLKIERKIWLKRNWLDSIYE